MALDCSRHRPRWDVERGRGGRCEAGVDVLFPPVVGDVARGCVRFPVDDQLLVAGEQRPGLISDVGHLELDGEVLAFGGVGGSEPTVLGGPSPLHSQHLELELAVADR